MDLIGEDTNTQTLPAQNFTATWGERSCDYGQWLINDTHLQILDNGTGGSLDFGPGGLISTNNATHICLEHVGKELSQQAYSTIEHTLDSQKYWIIKGGTGAN